MTDNGREADGHEFSAANRHERREGIAAGVGAYVLWGLFPLYFPLLEPANAVEILAHRIVWSLLATAAVVAIRRRVTSLRAVLRSRRSLLLLVTAAMLLAGNWVTYIYAVNTERVIDGSLGYFITPLVTAFFGVTVLRERLSRQQALALALGACAVAVLAADYAGPPWIALTLAVTFATYGLVKKLVNLAAAESLFVETLVLFPLALAYLLVLELQGAGTFAHNSAEHALLLVAAGPVTTLPLLLFSAAVTRIPLILIGMLQYVAPMLQFLIGLLVVSEAMPTNRWIGFTLVWAALALLTLDAARTAQRARSGRRAFG